MIEFNCVYPSGLVVTRLFAVSGLALLISAPIQNVYAQRRVRLSKAEMPASINNGLVIPSIFNPYQNNVLNTNLTLGPEMPNLDTVNIDLQSSQHLIPSRPQKNKLGFFERFVGFVEKSLAEKNPGLGKLFEGTRNLGFPEGLPVNALAPNGTSKPANGDIHYKWKNFPGHIFGPRTQPGGEISKRTIRRRFGSMEDAKTFIDEAVDLQGWLYPLPGRKNRFLLTVISPQKEFQKLTETGFGNVETAILYTSVQAIVHRAVKMYTKKRINYEKTRGFLHSAKKVVRNELKEFEELQKRDIEINEDLRNEWQHALNVIEAFANQIESEQS